MDTANNKEGNQCNQENCGCGYKNKWVYKGGCGGHHWAYHILRWILGIVVLVLVFNLGMQIGVLKGMLEGGGHGYSNHSHMSMGYGQNNNW